MQVVATPSGPITNPPPSIHPIFMPDAIPATTLPIYPGLGHAQEYAGLHTPVAWFTPWCNKHKKLKSGLVASYNIRPGNYTNM